MLTITDVCKELQISRTTFWVLRQEDFPAPIIVGKVPRWRRADVDAWLAAR